MARNRKDIPQKTVDAITTQSRRVCAMCWGLQRDGRGEKEGQLAHINGKNDDDREKNLCWLCLFHHNRYDGRMRLSKNFSPSELRVYKAEVEKAVAAQTLPSAKQGGGALLAVAVAEAILGDIQSGFPRLVVWVTCCNQGSAPTGIREVALRYLGREAAIFSPSLGRDDNLASFHPDAETLRLGPKQIIPPGGMVHWSINFHSLHRHTEFIPHDLEGSFTRTPSRKIEWPIELTITPVSGVPVTVSINALAYTWFSLSGILETEQLNRECAEETEFQRRWREQERMTSLTRPFPTEPGRLMFPTAFYRRKS